MDLESVSEFDARDGDLNWLIVETLIDLDNYLDNREYEDKSIKHLAYLLNDATQVKKYKNQIREPNALNFINYGVLINAIFNNKELREEFKGRHQNNLLVQLNLVARDLRDYKILPKSKVEEIGNFCSDLLGALQYYQETECPIRKTLAA